MNAGVALIRADNVVLNVAMISAFHREPGKLFVHYAGGRIWTFLGPQADAMWAKLSEVSQDLMVPADLAG